MPTKISRQKLSTPNLGKIDFRKIDKALRLRYLAEFFQAHDHISDEALLNAGEVVMDGPAFYKLRRAFL